MYFCEKQRSDWWLFMFIKHIGHCRQAKYPSLVQIMAGWQVLHSFSFYLKAKPAAMLGDAQCLSYCGLSVPAAWKTSEHFDWSSLVFSCYSFVPYGGQQVPGTGTAKPKPKPRPRLWLEPTRDATIFVILWYCDREKNVSAIMGLWQNLPGHCIWLAR